MFSRESSCFLRLSLKQSYAVVFGARATTAQLYPGQDTFEFDYGHVTKNQPITVFVLLSESLDIEQKELFRRVRDF